MRSPGLSQKVAISQRDRHVIVFIAEVSKTPTSDNSHNCNVGAQKSHISLRLSTNQKLLGKVMFGNKVKSKIQIVLQ